MKPRLKEWLPRAYSNQCIIRRPKAKLNHVIICKACTCITSANLPLAKTSHMAEINNSGMWKYTLPTLVHRNITLHETNGELRTQKAITVYKEPISMIQEQSTQALKYILMRNNYGRRNEWLIHEFNNGKLLLKSQKQLQVSCAS